METKITEKSLNKKLDSIIEKNKREASALKKIIEAIEKVNYKSKTKG